MSVSGARANHELAPRQTGDDVLVSTSGLTKRYGRVLAVDRLEMSVHRGEVYGFLGPNGAGKTTTLKMLLGLIRPTSGTAVVAGHEPGSPRGLAQVGALVESPAFYPFLSGRDNLIAMAEYSGAPTSRVADVLELVELSTRAGDKYGGYSLGMKQRLGVAAALLKQPELLILDEPTNGLDPKGMAEMRALIRELGQGERTVLLSSHLLNEVEQICDRVGVIHRGRLIAEGAVSEIRGRGALIVRAQPEGQALELVRAMPEVGRAEIVNGALRIEADPASAAEINRELVGAGVMVSELRPVQQSLEEVFLELTSEEEG